MDRMGESVNTSKNTSALQIRDEVLSHLSMTIMSYTKNDQTVIILPVWKIARIII